MNRILKSVAAASLAFALGMQVTGCEITWCPIDDPHCNVVTPSPAPGNYPPPPNVVRHMDISYASGYKYDLEGNPWLDADVLWHGIKGDGSDPFEQNGYLTFDAYDFDDYTLWAILAEEDTLEGTATVDTYYDGRELLVDIATWRDVFRAVHGRTPEHVQLLVLYSLPVKQGEFPQDYSGYGYTVHAKGGSTVTWPYNAGALFPAWPSTNVGITWEVGNMPQFPGETTVYVENIDHPTAQYMFAWAHSNYVVSDISADTRTYSYPGDDRIPTASQHAQAYLDTAVSYLGQYPYGPDIEGYTYGVVQVEWNGGGGMEHQYDVHIDGDSGDNTTVAHELCHAWFSTSIRYAFPEDFALSEGVCTWMGYELVTQVDGEAAGQAQWDRNNAILSWYIGKEAMISWPTTSGEVVLETLYNETALYFRGAEFLRAYAYAIGGNDGHYRMFELLGEYHALNAGTAQYFGGFVEFLGERTGIDAMRYAVRALRELDDPREDLAAWAEEDYLNQQTEQLRCNIDPSYHSKQCW